MASAMWCASGEFQFRMPSIAATTKATPAWSSATRAASRLHGRSGVVRSASSARPRTASREGDVAAEAVVPVLGQQRPADRAPLRVRRCSGRSWSDGERVEEAIAVGHAGSLSAASSTRSRS